MNYCIRVCSLLAIIFVTNYSSLGQRLQHVQGDILISIADKSTPDFLTRYLSTFNNKSISLKYEQVTATPMNIWLVKFDHNVHNEQDLLEKIKTIPGIYFAQKNHITTLRKTPEDPLFAEQWQYINTGTDNGTIGADIDMDLAWDITTGGLTAHGDTIVICVIDDGIDPNHEDFEDNIWINYGEIPNNNIDDDNNGYVDDYRGWDMYNDTDNIYEDGSHGTAVAGIIGAKANNEKGVASVNWDVKMMIIRGGSPESRAIASFSYAYTMRKKYNDTDGAEGAFVVATNASWGVDFGQPDDAPLWCAYYDTLGTQGIINFGATINGNVNVDQQGDLPTACSSEYLVGVTNLNRNDQKVNNAGFGSESIDLGAYGEETYTTSFNNGYGGFGGTSGATPHVSGVAALLYSVECDALVSEAKSNPAGAALAVRDYILFGTVPNESLSGITSTEGRLNAKNALDLSLQACAECPYPLAINIDEAEPEAIKISWTPITGADSYTLQYRLSGASNWEIMNTTSAEVTIANLLSCSEYEVQVKSSCGNLDSDYGFTRIISTEGCCELPSNITTTVSSGSINFSWPQTEYVSNYIFEYRIDGDSEWIAVNVDSQNYTLENIANCTSIQYRIMSQCSEYNTLSELSPMSFITSECGSCTDEGYCDFDDGKDSEAEWIESVELDDLINVSGPETTGYGNYLGGESTVLTAGNSYEITLTPGYAGTTYEEYFTVWIDWNQDQSFDEETEIAFDPGMVTEESITGTIEVPFDIIPGTTRMRVIMAFENKEGPCDPGPNFRYGEVEDYCVELATPSPCNTNLEATIVDSTLSSVSIDWINLDIAYTYIVGYKKVSANTYTDVEVTDFTDYTFSDLEECTNYDYRIKAICGTEEANFQTGVMKTKCLSSTFNAIDDFEIVLLANPVIDQINLEVKANYSHNFNSKIYNTSGQIVNQASHHTGAGIDNINIDISQLSAGIYIVHLSNQSSQKAFKIIKL